MSFPKYSLEYEILICFDGVALYHVTRYISFKTPNKSVWHDVGKNKKVNVTNLKTNMKKYCCVLDHLKKKRTKPCLQLVIKDKEPGQDEGIQRHSINSNSISKEPGVGFNTAYSTNPCNSWEKTVNFHVLDNDRSCFLTSVSTVKGGFHFLFVTDCLPRKSRYKTYLPCNHVQPTMEDVVVDFF